MRVFGTPYVLNWEQNRQAEIQRLTSQGILPHEHEMKTKYQDDVPPEVLIESQAMLMGQVAGNIEDVKSAKEIVDDMIKGAQQVLSANAARIQARL